MLYLYMDESGDLGFDFVNKKPSKFFTITILAVLGTEMNRSVISAVKKTLKRKLNPKGKRNRIVQELHGVDLSLAVKKYFYTLIKELPLKVYSITLNKKRVFESLIKNKSRVYNFIARKVLDHIAFETDTVERIHFFVDKSKNKPEIVDFNQYITKQLEGRIDPKTPLEIMHKSSQDFPGLQVADLFSYGIFQNYERGKSEWYDVFKSKIIYNEKYLP